VDPSQPNNPNHVFGYQGAVDEVRVWDTVRTDQEIQATWNTVLTNEPGLVLVSNFNDPNADNKTFNNTVPNGLVVQAEGPQATPPNTVHTGDIPLLQRIVVLAADPTIHEVKNEAVLYGTSKIGYNITLMSDALKSALNSSFLMINDSMGVIAYNSAPHVVDLQPIVLIFHCDTPQCTNIPAPTDELYFLFFFSRKS